MSARQDVIELLRSNGNEAITLTWPQFYKVTKRDRLHDSFMDKLKAELLKDDINIIYGNNTVLIARDFCWKRVDL